MGMFAIRQSLIKDGRASSRYRGRTANVTLFATHHSLFAVLDIEADMLRIYGVARTRAFRAIWMAKELGLEYEHIPIETGAAGARKPDYLAINPNGRLPSIDDDGFILWESLAINLYLAKKHGRLCPATLEGEARAWQWCLWAANEVERGVTSGRCMHCACRPRTATRSCWPRR